MFIFETRKKRAFSKNNLKMVRMVGCYDGVSKMELCLLILFIMFVDQYNADYVYSMRPIYIEFQPLKLFENMIVQLF